MNRPSTCGSRLSRRASKATSCAPAAPSASKIARVVETERRVARDGHAHRRAARTRRGAADRGQGARPGRRFVRNGEQAIEVHLGGNCLRNLVHARTRVARLVARDEAEMTFHDAQALVVLHRAEHRNAGVVGDHGAQLGFVARTPELIQDHAGDADVPVERLVAEDERRDTARHPARVDHQHHRCADQRGERGVAVAAVKVESVVQALVALDDAERGTLHAPRDLGADLLRAAQVGVEVVAGPPGGEPQPQGINVVGPLLERLHRFAPRSQGGAQPDAHRGLARGLVGRGDEKTVHAVAELTSLSARLCGRKGNTLTATAVSASASAMPPTPSMTSGRLGV